MNHPIGLVRGMVATWCLCFAGTVWAALPASSFGPAYPSPPPAEPAYMEDGAAQGLWDFGGKKCFPADCFCYRWQIWANALFLTRSSADDMSLAFGPPKEGEVTNADEMDFGFRWGPSIGAYYCCNECTSIGAEFFFIDGWNASGTTSGDISVQFPSLVHFPVASDGVANYNYASRLYNVEVNARRRTNDWFTVLAGFRWIELSEDFATTFATGGNTSSYLIDVDNQLWGFQVGALANYRGNGWGLDAWGKVGIFANWADQSTYEDLAALAGGTSSVGASDQNAAFAGDLGVALVWNMTDRLSARIGYQLLWLEGVALAPDQLDNSNPSIPLATLDNSGGVFYHGGIVGLEYLW